jgi:putative two-component system response regulator
VRAWEAGVDDFLTKPFHPVELVARTRSLCKVKEYHDLQAHYRVQLEQTVRERTTRLRQAVAAARAFSIDTVERLSRTAEYRDNDTGEHIKRLSGYAVEVARGMRLGMDLVGRLRLAVPLHDIGKVGIPDRILLKPGRLTPEEMEVMKQHTTIGARILAGSRSSTMTLAEEIALTHHERWDGTGYPRGLRGDAIPAAGRVTAVVDVFDALCSRRPYKAPMLPEAAISIVVEGRSTHFDPAVVDSFLAARPQILRLQDKLRDSGPGLLRALDGAFSGDRDASPPQGVRR